MSVTDVRTRGKLAGVLGEARQRIQVSDEELDEARRRRDLLASTLRAEFGPGSRTYLNGSVAHGDALTPLTDIDLGVVVPDPDGAYGPLGLGPETLQRRVADAIRRDHRSEFPNLRIIVEGRKRSVYVSFGSPVDPSQDDFSADVIVALDYPLGEGLWIPNYDSWDRSDPETHTEFVRGAARSSNYNYSRTIRLLKHWARTHSKPLCSWNIKALGLACLAADIDQLAGLVAWFDHAIADLSWRDTPDPAGVAGAIGLPGDRMELVAKLKRARDKLSEAVHYDIEGYDVLAVEALAVFFNDDEMLPHPPAADVEVQRLQRSADMRRERVVVTVPANSSSPRVRDRTPVRSWAP